LEQAFDDFKEDDTSHSMLKKVLSEDVYEELYPPIVTPNDFANFKRKKPNSILLTPRN
jgi:hypothetical protein